MEAEESDKKKLKELLKGLEKVRGRHTELVTVYIPAGYNLVKIVDQIRTEQSTAQNIKSKTVRKNVLSALESILQHLKLYKQTPKNGLVIFSGNVSEKEGTADVKVWSVEPPEPVKNKLYWCGQTFILEPLKEIFKEKEVYGLILVDRSDAEIGLLYGKKIQPLKHLDSLVPGKTKKGGWSQARYARIREGLLNDFLKKVGEVSSDLLKKEKDLRGVIIGGPGPIKEQFYEGDYLDYSIKKMILGVVSTSYTGEYGLTEVVEKSEDLIAQAAVMREKKVLDRFFDELGKGGLAAYGLEAVAKMLDAGNVDTLLISEDFDWVKVKLTCSCGFSEERVVDRAQVRHQECPKCAEPLESENEENIVDALIKKAEDIGGHVQMISNETQKGIQLIELGGIGAILRYKPG